MKDNPKKPHRIKKGEVANPEGKNGFSTGLQPYSKRAENYLDKFKASEIIAIAADPVKLDAFTSWDAIVLRRLAACLNSPTNSDERQEVEAFLNRKEGKPVERK